MLDTVSMDQTKCTRLRFNPTLHRKNIYDLLIKQQLNFPLWQKEDKFYDDQLILEQDFTDERQMKKNLWQFASFVGGRSIEFPEPRITSQWDISNNLRVNKQGLLLKNMIIQTCTNVKLRSLACEVHIKGRLVGSSSLWIFTRLEGDKSDIQA